MKKRIFILSLIAIMLLGLLAGCKDDGPLTTEEVRQLVAEHSGASAREAQEAHVHLQETDDGVVCFNVYITVGGKSFTYIVHSITGEFLSITEGGSHSH